MSISDSRRLLLTAAATAFLLLAATAALGDSGGWQLRFGAPWVSNDLEYREADEGTNVEVLGQEGYGLGLSAEYRMTQRLGWEVGVQWSRNDIDLVASEPGLRLSTSDEATPLMISFGPDFHLTPNRKADLYAGPMVAYMFNNDLAFSVLGETLDVEVDNGYAWGAVVGLDYPIGDGAWVFCTSIRYLEADVDMGPVGEPPLTLAVDPLSVGVGFGYVF